MEADLSSRGDGGGGGGGKRGVVEITRDVKKMVSQIYDFQMLVACLTIKSDEVL